MPKLIAESFILISKETMSTLITESFILISKETMPTLIAESIIIMRLFVGGYRFYLELSVTGFTDVLRIVFNHYVAKWFRTYEVKG